MRTVRQGAFSLPCSPAVSILLFTPEGERQWVHGWQPEYLSGALDEVGAVWRTSVDAEVTWLTTDRDADRVRYARLSSDGTAGLVEVRCTAAGDGTRVDVTYDLTALSAAGRDALSSFADRFPRHARPLAAGNAHDPPGGRPRPSVPAMTSKTGTGLTHSGNLPTETG